MTAGIAALFLAYVLSQFYRVFLAVIAPALAAGIGVGPDDLAQASGLWFLAFALMQFPVGWALDRIGPRATVSVLLGVCGSGGALIFALAQGPMGISLGMILIGIGCSPVLMASYYIFGRTFSPALFGTLAGVIIGVGGIGNLGGSVPLSMAVQAFGWRQTVLVLAMATALVGVALALLVRDPPRVAGGGAKGSLRDVLRIPALWLILPMMAATYGPAIAVRGLWVGPYLADVHGASATGIGRATLVMALAMIAGNFAYGPADRLFGTRKGVVLAGTLLGALCFGALALWPGIGMVQAGVLLCGIGFFGASFSMIMAHGRAFLPPHLLGRGVTLINFFGIAGAGVMQALSGPLHKAYQGPDPAQAYAALFWMFTAILLCGSALYLLSRDRTD